MKVSRVLGVVCFGMLFLPLLFVQGQPVYIDGTKEARDLFGKYTDKLQPVQAKPKELVETLRELEAIAYEIHVRVPIRVEQMLLHRDPAVRRQAAKTLAAIGADPFTASSRVGVLVKHLKEERDPEVVETLLLALSHIGPLAKEALPVVVESFKHDDPRVRRGAMGFFVGFVPEDKSLMPTIVAALDDPDEGYPEKKKGYGSVSMMALTALGRYGSDAKEAVPKLTKMVKDRKHDDFYEIVTLRTILRINPDEAFALNVAREWLRRQDSPEHLIKAAGLIPKGAHGKPALAELIAALKGKPFPDPKTEQRVKLALVESLRWIGTDAKEALPALRALADTPNLVVRRQVEKSIKAIEASK